MTTLNITLDDNEIKRMLADIHSRISNLTPAMRIIGQIVRTSVVRNFEVGGRHRRWAQLSPATLAHRRGRRILMDRGMGGGLAGSIHATAGRNSVTIGTNKIYASVHQFGARKGSFGEIAANVRAHIRSISQAFGRTISPRRVTVRAHTRKMTLPWGNIPARPFLMVHPEDWDEIRESLNDYILTRSR